ncbi:MAG TPA: glycoside hydrolase family 30 beta sandwich domain-containing protein, partial [Mucilaginibacter sp.]|nr:glycoside hydrolase family 30 beta sandwich domain-containing protein [Mucilaginibacter sp.]
FYTSKMLWALGNYSRFIKPGAKRIDAASPSADLKTPLRVSAFKNHKEVTLVIINPNADDVNIALSANGTKIKFTTSYTTSATDELKPAAVNGADMIIKGRSVVTLVGKLK